MAFGSTDKSRPVVPNEPTQTAAPALTEIVSESTQRLADAEQIGVKIKRGRGRPRKDGTVSQSAPGAPNSSSQSNAVPGAFPHFSLAPVLEQGIKIPFAVHAASTGFDGWNLSDTEAKLIGTQLDEVMRLYMPAMDPRTASLAMLAGSLAMVAGGRFVAQKEWEKTQAAKAKPISGNPSANGTTKPTEQKNESEPTSGKSIADALGAIGMH